MDYARKYAQANGLEKPPEDWHANLYVAYVNTKGLQMIYTGVENIPSQGGVLVISNHQSHFDPPLVGAGCRRQMNYLARDSLFRFAPFRWLIRSLDAIPIDRPICATSIVCVSRVR